MNGAGGVTPPCSWGMASEPQQSRRARLLALAALPAGRAGALASPQCTPPQSRRLQLLAAFRGDAAGSLSVPTGGVPAPSNGPAAGAAADPSRSRRGALAAAKSKKVARPSLLARRGQKRKAHFFVGLRCICFVGKCDWSQASQEAVCESHAQQKRWHTT